MNYKEVIRKEINMKNKISKVMLALLLVVSTFVGNISVNAAPYNLHEEFATDWSYASGKTGLI